VWTSFIGFMASGKSATVELLKQGTQLPAVDLDTAIETRAGCSLPEIFQREGITRFRELENEALVALDPHRSYLLATGGGCVETPANVQLLRQRGVVIWLDAAWEVLRRRIENDDVGRRPLVEHLGWDGLQQLFLQRRRTYAAAAHFRLRTDHMALAVAARNALLRGLLWRRRLEGEEV
jgi:shikimate kinase